MTDKLLKFLLNLITWLTEYLYGLDIKINFPEIKIMIRVKADNPDVKVVLTLPTVTDSEGSNIPVYFGEVTSDNEAAVSVNTDGDETTVTFGKANEDGSPALANLNVEILDEDETVITNYSATVEVSHGDPVSVTGGGLALEGLTDDSTPA